MRPWPEAKKAILRHLSAARFFLPVHLEVGEFPDSEQQLYEFLHQSEFELALEELEGLGESNRGYAEESLFWSELILAAEQMKLPDHAERCRARLRECEPSAKADT